MREWLGPGVLSIERVRMFSMRAREYMAAYYFLEKHGKAVTPVNLDNLKKERKSHTDVIDISYGWISEVMKEVVLSMKEIEEKKNKNIYIISSFRYPLWYTIYIRGS